MLHRVLWRDNYEEQRELKKWSYLGGGRFWKVCFITTGSSETKNLFLIELGLSTTAVHYKIRGDPTYFITD